MTLQVQAGKYYKTRDGKHVMGPMQTFIPGTLRYQLRCPNSSIFYTGDGRVNPGGPPHNMDVVQECDAQGNALVSAGWSSTQTMAITIVGTSNPLKVQVGRHYKRRDGQLAGPMEATSSVNFPFRCSARGHTYMADGSEYSPINPSWNDLIADATPATSMGIPGPTGSSGDIGDIGDLVTRALATQSAKESAELERMRALPTAEQRLEEYRRNVAKLAERGNLY